MARAARWTVRLSLLILFSILGSLLPPASVLRTPLAPTAAEAQAPTRLTEPPSVAYPPLDFVPAILQTPSPAPTPSASNKSLTADSSNVSHVVMRNDYLAVDVVSSDSDARTEGKFTLGDVNKTTLLFGHPEKGEETYALVWVNDQEYYLNDEAVTFIGTQLDNATDPSHITSIWEIPSQSLRIKQELSFADTYPYNSPHKLLIKYYLINTSTTSSINAGIRIILDTAINNDDGAPFIIQGETSVIDRPKKWSQPHSSIPVSWRTYDNLDFSAVEGEGILQGPGLTTPSTVIVDMWGALKRGDWDYIIGEPNYDFNYNAPKDESGSADTAIALTYNPELLNADQTRTYSTLYGLSSVGVPNDRTRCPGCNEENGYQEYVLQPINTRTGNLWYGAHDLSLETPGPAMGWSRIYNSQAVAETNSGLGGGWQHPYASRLINDAQGLRVLAANGNVLRYEEQDGVLVGTFGAYSTLTPTNNNNTYVQTFRDQSQQVFNANGQLILTRDPRGRAVAITYSTTAPDEIALIQDVATPSRQLLPTYATTPQGRRIVSISDGHQRTVSYAYSAESNGTKTITATDLLGGNTVYTFTASGLLTKVVNPLGLVEEETEYDQTQTPATAKALRQIQPNGSVGILTYGTTATTLTMKTADESAVLQTEAFLYDSRSVITSTMLNSQTVQTTGFDGAFRPGLQIDGAGGTTHTSFGAMGRPTQIVNALGHTTTATYTNEHRPSIITDTLGVRSELGYDTDGHLITHTVGITDANPLGFTTLYTYTKDTFTNTRDLLTATQDQRGIVTTYQHNAADQVLTTTLAANTPFSQTTTYGYDDLGRVMTTTLLVGTPAQRMDLTFYNAAGAITQTVQNSTTITLDPTTENLVTRYAYDALGRQVWVKLPDGRVDVTHFNAKGQVDWTAQNWTGTITTVRTLSTPIPAINPLQPDKNIITAYGYDDLGRRIWTRDPSGSFSVTSYNPQGQVAWSTRNYSATTQITPTAPLAFVGYSATAPMSNVTTLYAYDKAGRTTWVTETGVLTGSFNLTTQTFAATTTRVTSTTYDLLGRPITTTTNFEDGIVEASEPDLDLQQVRVYDNGGRLAGQRDAQGRWTVTEYDALSRPVTVTTNYEDGNPITLTVADAQNWGMDTEILSASTDLMEVTRYRSDGLVDMVIENYRGNGTFNVNEPQWNRATRYEYDVLGRVITTTVNYVPNPPVNHPELNQVQVTHYDEATGQVAGLRDPIGRWSVFNYDVLGRTTDTVQHCTDSNGMPQDSWLGCAPYLNSTANIDRNAHSHTSFDGMGRPVQQIDAAGRVTSSQYDGMGRTIARISNADQGVSGTGLLADTNLTTRYQFDLLGRTTLTTDTLGITTTTQYDGLGRAWRSTDGAGRISTNGGDAAGLRRWSRAPGLGVNVTESDLLGRPVRQIANYHNGVLDGDPADRDLITRTGYDRLTNTQIVTGTDGQVTEYGYDLLNRLVWVRENVTAGCVASDTDCKVVTQYTYDRAGNRVSMIDGRGTLRLATFDAANNEVASWVVDGQQNLVHIVRTYDALGRVVTEGPANDATKLVTYAYDGLDRITQTLALGDATYPISIGRRYDPLPLGGQLAELKDATGTTSYDYDDLGRPTAITDGFGRTVEYRYTARSQRAQLRYPDGTTVLDYTYAPDGQLATVTQGTTVLANHTYDSAGRLAQLQRTGGMTTTYTYDAVSRPQQLRTNATNKVQFVQQYRVDRAGQRTSVIDWVLPQQAFTATGVITKAGNANGQDRPRVVRTDAQGNVYQVGSVNTTGKGFDLYVAKYSPQLQKLWEKIYDDGRSDHDLGNDVTVDASGFVYVTGKTRNSVGNYDAITLVFSPTAPLNEQQVYRDVYVGSGYDDEGRRVALGSDGSLYVAGHTRSSGTNQNILLMRYTRNGDVWSRQTPVVTYQGTSNLDDAVAALQIDGSGTILIAGTVRNQRSGSASEDMAVLGYTASTLTLSRELVYHDNGPEQATALAVAPDGTLYVTGWRQKNTSQDILTLRYAPGSTTFSSEWIYNRIGINKHDVASAVEVGQDGTVYVLGKAQNSANSYEYITLAYTPTATSEAWSTIYPYESLAPADTEAMQQDGLAVGDSGYLYAGVAINRNMGTGTDLRMLIYSPDGQLVGESTATSGAATNGTDAFAPFSINVATGIDARVYLSGYVVNPGPQDDIVLLGYQPFTRTETVYDYDGLHRLTETLELWSGGSSYAYGYDAVGNRTSATVNGTTTSWGYNAADQVQGWSYDAAGNLIDDGVQTYRYDALGRLRTVTDGSAVGGQSIAPSPTASYRYNGDGVLFASTIDGTDKTTYTQDLAAPLSHILVEQTQDGIKAPVTTTSLYGMERLANIRGGVRSWEIHDALGSVRLTLADSAAIQTQLRYDPWGIPTTGTPAPFGFTGELQDSATGLTYLRARWYQPGTGRFVSRDPFAGMFGLPITLHKYQYAVNNPISYLDPTGEIAIFWAGFGSSLQDPTNPGFEEAGDTGVGTSEIGVWKMADELRSMKSKYPIGGVLKVDQGTSQLALRLLVAMAPPDEPVILVGHSLGATNVYDLAAMLPRVDLLVTIGIHSAKEKFYDLCDSFGIPYKYEGFVMQKPHNVIRHMNFMGVHWTSNLVGETRIAGAENYALVGTSKGIPVVYNVDKPGLLRPLTDNMPEIEHDRLDDEFLDAGVFRNPIWDMVFDGIDEVTRRYHNR